MWDRWSRKRLKKAGEEIMKRIPHLFKGKNKSLQGWMWFVINHMLYLVLDWTGFEDVSSLTPWCLDRWSSSCRTWRKIHVHSHIDRLFLHVWTIWVPGSRNWCQSQHLRSISRPALPFSHKSNLVISSNAFLGPRAMQGTVWVDAGMKTVFYPYPVVDIHLFIAFVQILHFDVMV